MLEGTPHNSQLDIDHKVYKQDLYFNFIEDNPDYAPKAKRTVSRTGFYRWLNDYNECKYDCPAEDGKDMMGRWIIFKKKDPEIEPTETQSEDKEFEF